jgi:diaminopimelate epimerase
MQLPFTKMHGLGNDFMVIDLISHPATLSSQQIRALADRHCGVGFDQLLLIEPPTQPDVDFNYRIFNGDGNEVEHCGNGARCFARFVLDAGLTSHRRMRVQTLRGVIVLSVADDGCVTVDMGQPDFTPAALPLLADQAPSYRRTLEVNGARHDVQFFAVSVGNPHAVLVVDNLERAAVREIGTALGSHHDFPRGVNVGFMQIIDRAHIRLRVFERGAGETQACGTGACAAVVCGRAAGLLDAEVEAQLTGGLLKLRWDGPGEPIIMRGPATRVFDGSLELDQFS